MFGKKPKKRSAEQLREKFEALGVDQIEFCIEDEMDTDSGPLLSPLVLFHEIWQGVLPKGDTAWFEETAEQFRRRAELEGVAAAFWPQEPDVEEAIAAIEKSGLNVKHLTTLIRRFQETFVYHVAHKLSDSHTDDERFSDVNWAVFETDEDGNALEQMNVLHELAGLVNPDRDRS